MTPPQDIERWTEALAGRAKLDGARAQREVETLGNVVRAEDEDARAAAAADTVALERLRRKLDADVPPAVAPSRSRHVRAWLALAASVVVAVLLMREDQLLEPLPQTPTETTRGVAGAVSIPARDPEARAVELLRELADAGLAARRVPAADRIVIEVTVDAARLERFRAWAEPSGLQAGEPGAYRLIIVPAGQPP